MRSSIFRSQYRFAMALRHALRRLLPAAGDAAPALSRAAHFGQQGNWTKPTTLDVPTPGDGKVRKVTVLKGDGVGPLVVNSALEAVQATGGRPSRLRCCRAVRGWAAWAPIPAPAPGAPVEWEEFALSGMPGSAGYATTVPKEILDSIARNKVCLKGAGAQKVRYPKKICSDRACTAPAPSA